MHHFAFPKAEHLTSRREIEALFSKGSMAAYKFPLRAIFHISNSESVPVKVLISVSKRHFKHAVDRNRAKRQIREAYRLHKQVLWDTACAQGTSLHIAFLWTANMPLDSDKVTRSVISLLETISTHLQNSRP